MKHLLLILALLVSTAAFAAPPGQIHGLMWSWVLSPSQGVILQDLYCGTAAGGENYSTPVATLSATATSYLYQGGVAGTKYYCTVTASNTFWESVPSNEAAAIYPCSHGKPCR